MSKEFFSIYENAISSESCRQIVDRFEASEEKHPGRVGDGTADGSVKPEVKSTTELILDGRPEWQDVLQLFHQSLQLHSKEYLKKWGAAIRVGLEAEDLRIQKYDAGGFFDWHSDNVGGALTRMITVIWYLNTVEAGGETEYVWQQARIKPREGCLLLCPVGWTYFHRGAAPVTGPKYIAITQLRQVIK